MQRNESLLNGTGSPRNSTHLNPGEPVSGTPTQMNGMVGGASGSLPTVPGAPKLRDSIHLAACSANEILPMQSPDLPYDIFTACLTTPIKAALHWYVSQRMGTSTLGGNGNGPQVKQIIPGLTMEMLDRIPGQINDRRTMMGELNWIFTAITDTIAWNVLDSDMFQVGFLLTNMFRFHSIWVCRTKVLLLFLETFSTRSSSGIAIQELFARRAHHEITRLQPRVASTTAGHQRASVVAGMGSGSGHVH